MSVKTDDLPGVEGPGVSRPKIKEIEVAADKYVEVRDSRMALTEKEITARDKLTDLMKKHSLKEYVFDDHKVVVVPGKDKVSVKIIGDAEDEE